MKNMNNNECNTRQPQVAEWINNLAIELQAALELQLCLNVKLAPVLRAEILSDDKPTNHMEGDLVELASALRELCMMAKARNKKTETMIGLLEL
jgi:hypothetical protein